MVKVKRFLSLLTIVFLVLNNFALAQYTDSSYYEGKPIDESREGIDYYGEGDVIVYPRGMGSSQNDMMERFRRGDIDEGKMREIAKEKFGEGFDEIEFEKGMLEMKERAKRKEAFSYEHSGFGESYYMSPSYEGYSKEHMIYGMVFEHIGDDIDPREIKQYCSEPEKIADIAISKLKEKIGGIQNVCARFGEQESKCLEYSKKSCSQLGTSIVRESATDMEKLQAVAYSCPPNKDAITEACRKRSMNYMEQRMENAAEVCKKRFDFEGERLVTECKRFNEQQVCGKEKYIERCMGGAKKEDFEKKCPEANIPSCETGNALQKKLDSNGCAYYYCETSSKSEIYCEQDSDCACGVHIKTGECFSGNKNYVNTNKQCPDFCSGFAGDRATKCMNNKCTSVSTQFCRTDTKQCSDGSYVARDSSKNCEFRECPPTTVPCQEPVVPICASGQILQMKTGDKECMSYYCAASSCPEVTKPTCAADEHLQAYYGNAGCITSYQCIRQTTCPTIEKPICAEGQSMTTRHDDKGCVSGYECVSLTTTTNSIKITGNVVVSNYDEMLNKCENSWIGQQKICSNIENQCDKNTFIARCEEQERKNYRDFLAKVGQHCESQTSPELRHAEQRCAGMDMERQKCIEQSAKRCSQMKGMAQQCRELLTEENLRNFILREAKKRCKFTDIIEDEDDISKADKAGIVLAVLNTAAQSDIDKLELFVENLKEELKLQDTIVYKGTINPSNFGDIKLLPFVVNAKISTAMSSERAKEVKAKIVAGQKAEEAASRLVSLRDSDVPAEYLYIIEDKASDVLDVSDSLEEIEEKDGQKGIGYKVRLFLGLAKKAEEVEIKQLSESKDKLKSSIETLTKLIDEVPSDVAKAILKEQVENLKQQQADIEVLIETKSKKSKGLFGVFG